jgi:hypothetical protein
MEKYPHWSRLYKGTTLKDKPMYKRVWLALPKYLYWKIWIVHNKAIFKQELENPNIVAAKAKGLLAEYIKSKGRQNHGNQCLNEDEKEWLNQFQLVPSSPLSSSVNPKPKSIWQLQLSVPDFQIGKTFTTHSHFIL